MIATRYRLTCDACEADDTGQMSLEASSEQAVIQMARLMGWSTVLESSNDLCPQHREQAEREGR